MRTGMARLLPELHTSKYCVAYLDVLGAKALMRKNSHKFLNDLNSIYYDAHDEVCQTQYYVGMDVSVRIFSDNILLFSELTNGAESNKQKIEHIIALAGNIYNTALMHGYLLRGAITIGDFFADKVFVYGKALVDAVDIEESRAIYPRVLVQKEVQDLFPQYFCTCSDGCFALNNFVFYDVPDTYKFRLLELCKQNKNNEKHMQKIMWAINFFNRYYTTYGGMPHSITKEEIANALTSAEKTSSVQEEKEVGDGE